MPEKGALLVGIDKYEGDMALHCCGNNVRILKKLFANNGDAGKTENFEVTAPSEISNRMELRAQVEKIFSQDLHTVLFYFSGHGCLTDRGAVLVTPDWNNFDEGVLMDELLTLANRSKIKNKIIIIDSCFSGAFGKPFMIGGEMALIADGLTIISASSPKSYAYTGEKHTVFSELLIQALEGGAADIGGNITPGSLYAHIDRSLGLSEQRPQFISNVGRFIPLRTTQPKLPDEVLSKIIDYFANPDEHYYLDPSYECTNCPEKLPKLKDPQRIDKNVEILINLQAMTRQSLVEPFGAGDMYEAAMNNKSCRLTPLGKHYWHIIRKKMIKSTGGI